ncbi:endonuclease [Photobacterium leiognathi]|uniref:endonuclease n=1 Tax=Photobacterium leiognathi TaxID=553611 RepID=UPI0027381BA2|nr:endonuclease [Photobacterium leiognathi]
MKYDVDRKGKDFKGRKCVEKANKEYRLMQSDPYNLYPAVGAVNATRQNYSFGMLTPQITVIAHLVAVKCSLTLRVRKRSRLNIREV